MQIGMGGIISIRSGTFGFITNKFTRPPIVICQLVRSNEHVWNSGPLYIYLFNITKDFFNILLEAILNQAIKYIG